MKTYKFLRLLTPAIISLAFSVEALAVEMQSQPQKTMSQAVSGFEEKNQGAVDQKNAEEGDDKKKEEAGQNDTGTSVPPSDITILPAPEGPPGSNIADTKIEVTVPVSGEKITVSVGTTADGAKILSIRSEPANSQIITEWVINLSQPETIRITNFNRTSPLATATTYSVTYGNSISAANAWAAQYDQMMRKLDDASRWTSNLAYQAAISGIKDALESAREYLRRRYRFRL